MQMSFPDYRVGWLLIALVRESVGHILQAVGVAAGAWHIVTATFGHFGYYWQLKGGERWGAPIRKRLKCQLLNAQLIALNVRNKLQTKFVALNEQIYKTFEHNYRAI